MNKNLEIALNKIYNTEVDIFFIEENEGLVCYKSRNHIIENEIPYIDFFEDCIIYINNNSKKYNIVLSKDENNIFINILFINKIDHSKPLIPEKKFVIKNKSLHNELISVILEAFIWVENN